MKLFRLALILLAAGATAPLCAAGCGQTPLSSVEYVTELDRLKQAATQLRDTEGVGALLVSTPVTCRIASDGIPIEVSFAWMRAALVEANQHPDRLHSQVADIAARLALMEAQATGSTAANDTDLRPRLSEILARREFKQVRQQSAWDIWRERIVRAVLYALEWIFSRVHVSRRASEALTWGVIGLLFVVIVYLVVRSIWRDRRPVPIPDILEPVRRSTPDWLRLAREAAGRGAYREAVHHAYWAAVASLEASGAWRPDRARTPREYLRVLPRAHTGWQPLAALTQRFERAWYGDRPVSELEFAEAVGELERLGCHSS